MTWEKLLGYLIPPTIGALFLLGGIVLKLWKSQGVTDLVIEQVKGLPVRMVKVETRLDAVVAGQDRIERSINQISGAFTKFANGGK